MFDLARSEYRGDCRAKEVPTYEGKTIRIVGDFVADKTVQTKNGDYIKFGTFYDVEGYFFDTVHFARSLSDYPLRGAGLYLLEGQVVMEFGCPSITKSKCGKMPLKNDPRSE